MSDAASNLPLRILLVDDEPTILEILGLYLEEEGHEVQFAADGLEAWERFQKEHYDLVITDRVMPRMMGDELARAIKQISATTPVIMVTGFADLKIEQDPSLQMVIRKPFTRETIRAAVHGLSRRLLQIAA